MTTLTTECIDNCNSLLRGELAAVETYRQAQEKFHGQPEAAALGQLGRGHEAHVAKLTSHIISMGGEPAPSSGAWGAFAQAVEGAAKAFGETSALQALIQGEKHGIGEYEAALENDDVMVEMKTAIRNEFLPALRRNISTLEAMQEVQ